MTARPHFAAETTVVGATVLMTAIPWFRAFPAGLLVPVLVPLIALPIGVAAATPAGGRWAAARWWLPAHAAVLVVVLLARGAGRPLALGAIADGYGNGLARLLSTTLPITTAPELLVVPVTIIWLTATFTSELALRLRAFGAAAGVALLGFAVAFGLTADSVGSSLLPAALLCVAVLALLGIPRRATPAATAAEAGVRHRGNRWPNVRTVRSGALWAGGALALAAATIPQLGHFNRPPAAPRRGVHVERQRLASPLATASALRRGSAGLGPNDIVFSVKGITPDARYLALMQLDDYDGGTWRLNREFEPTGGRVPADRDVPANGQAKQSFEVGRLVDSPASQWLPQAGRAQQLSGVAVRYEPLTGVVVPASATRAGERYEVRSEVPRGGLGNGIIAAPKGSHADTVPIEVGQELDRWIETVTRARNVPRAPTPAFLSAVLAEMRDRYATVDDSGGTSFAEIEGSLGTTQSATPEQFATLFALVARRAGVDARVVTGFRVGGASGAALPSSDRSVDVRSRDAWTWAIVPIVNVGWVVVDPTPDRSVPPARRSASAASTTTTTAPARPTTGGPRPTTLTPIDTTPVTAPTRSTGTRGLLALAVVAVTFVLAAGILSLVPLARVRRRRRRRRASDPRWRLVGAWHELLESVDRHQLMDGRRLASCTSTEAVALLRLAGLGGSDWEQPLIDGVNRSLHGPTPPTDQEIASVWVTTDNLRTSAARRRSRLARSRDWFRRPGLATVHRHP